MNFVNITGEIVETPVQKIIIGKSAYYKTALLVYGRNGKADVIPMVIPEREIERCDGLVSVFGALQSYKIGKARRVMVFVKSISEANFWSYGLHDTNLVFMSGTLKRKTEPKENGYASGIVFCHNRTGSYETIPIVARRNAAKDLWDTPIDEKVMVVGKLKSVVTSDKDGHDTGCKLLVFRIERIGGESFEDRIEKNHNGKLQMLSE